MDERVYLGFWTNWSRGPVFGQTLTTTKATGNLIIAFTAVFIGLVASRFWKIVSFILHRQYSTAVPKDTIHHQRQVILRNTVTPEASLLAAVQLHFSWRRSHPRPGRLFRLLPLILLSGFCLVFFSAAGVLSSNISTSVGDEVLLKGDHCGMVNVSSITTAKDERLFLANSAKELNKAANYAQQCYNRGAARTVECNRFVKNKLPTALADYNASCPFDKRICRSRFSNIVLDTGPLDSNDHFGLNAPLDQRFTFRYVLKCAPLETDGFTSNTNEAPGSQPSLTTHTKWKIPQHNTSIEGQEKEGVPTASGYVPIPELAQPDGDLTVAFLSGQGVFFSEPLDDLWYQATVPGSKNLTRVYNQVYRPREAASPLGCVEQYQWCSSTYRKESDQGCGPLASFYDAFFGAVEQFYLVGADTSRRASGKESFQVITWMVYSLISYLVRLYTVLSCLGERSLDSQPHISYGLMDPLPVNQWQLDVQHWFEIILSAFQAVFVGTALEPKNSDLENHRIKPMSSHRPSICNNQKIRSSAHTSFSVFGLSFTLALGVFVMAVSFALEPVSFFFCKSRKHKYANLEWSTNSSLQLHRLAHEELGNYLK
ncbi:hypothetical protein F5Y10DRAFT_288601 [Nemania abortiva]|nr:hypothetical protein F5Y10DRAFT_288601 [Nemania abortiva]